MLRFSPEDIDAIDQLWRSLPPGHMWTGWAAVGQPPETVWIYRSRAHWRRFPLTRTKAGYALGDDQGRPFREAATLEDLLAAVEAVPRLRVADQD
ncbi:hypothetical protein ACQKH5_15455 [Hyphomonas sp. NPDC076900]|uniref:Uncharacterized protein n=1 Tax=Hyphomonas polymorpha PS728 TaxID=1280954 RepID=A0A062VDA7_9PROT|nr:MULTISPECIES: hypothetical protein [Hyphomonas]AXE62776.1 hypothetical protein BBF93_00030 [Hyphomonas sp. CACIAM 19H1]KCZ97363.1 hypothetical protein HPO_15608 [Hyphomonas polymorpha PS728]